MKDRINDTISATAHSLAIAVAFSCLAATPGFAATIVVDTNNGEWTTASTWYDLTNATNDVLPTSADTATVADVTSYTLKHTVSASAEALNFYVENTATATSTFTIDGSVNSPVLNVGPFTGGATGLFELNRAGGDGNINIIGDNTTITADRRFRVGDQGGAAAASLSTLRWDFGAAGPSGDFVTDILDINGNDPNNTTVLIIDGTNYTGGPGIIDLIQFTTLAAGSDTGWDTITIQNFSGVADATVGFDSDSMFLQLAPIVPEPSSFALLLAGLAGLCFWCRRRKR